MTKKAKTQQWYELKIMELKMKCDEIGATNRDLSFQLQNARHDKTMAEVYLKQEQTDHKDDVHRMELRITDLEERLKFERNRTVQLLDVAEGASVAAGAIGRITNHLSEVVQQLEVRLENERRQAEKRLHP